MNASTRWAMRLSVMALALSVMAVFWVWAVKTTPCASAQATCPIALTRTISQGLTVNEDGADSDSRLEGDTNINLQYWDATTDAIGLGAVQVTGAFLGVTGYTTNRAGVTSVGREFHAPAGTFTQTNAASTTLAVGARYFIGVPTFAGSNASQVLTDAFTALYDAPAAGTNMSLTRAYTMGLSAGTTGTLWVSRDTDSTTAAGGLLFGLSRDVNLYRSAADTLRTDDTFNANTALLEAGNAVPNSTDNLGFFAATTSAQLAGVISDETGSGALLFATSPTMVGTWAGAVTFSGSTLTFSGGTVSTSISTGTIVISGSGGLGVGGQVTTGTLETTGSIGIGTARNTNIRAYIGGTFSPAGGDIGRVLYAGGTLNATAGDSATLVQIEGNIAEAGSLTHALLTGLRLTAPGIIAGAAAVTDAATLYITDQPSAAGATNSALLIAAGVSRLRDSTASTSTTTGALVVTGGAGIGGKVFTAGLHSVISGSSVSPLELDHSSGFLVNDETRLDFTQGTAIVSRIAGFYEAAGPDRFGIKFYTYSTSLNGTSSLTLNANGTVSVPSATASTSTTTGALVVTGGLGVGGKIYTGNDIEIADTFRLRSAGETLLFRTNATNTIQLGSGVAADLLELFAGAALRVRLTAVGNVKLAGTAIRATTEGTNHLDIFDGTAPVGTLANGISLYSTAGELRVMDSAGNATLLSPHDNLTNEWIFDSVNTTTGKTLKIDMERLVKAVNAEFGWNFVQEYSGSKPLIDAAGRQVYERRQKRGDDGKLLYEPMTETVTIEVEAATTSTPAKTRQEQRIMTRKQSVVVTKEVEIPVGQSGRFVKGKHDTIEERDVPIDDLTKPVMEDAAVMEAIYVPLPQTTVSTTIVDLRAQLAVLQARLAALEAKVP